jgi:hypothetical protein
MFQEWLRGRDDLYGQLSEADLMNERIRSVVSHR